MHPLNASRRGLRALCLLGCGIAIAAGAAGCGQPAGGASSPSPLPSLTPTQAPAAADERLQAGVGHSREVYFRSKQGEGLAIRVLKAVWRESLVATDGTAHEQVLAVAVRITMAGQAGAGSNLGMPAQLEITNRISRRSGRFPIEGELSTAELQPGEVRYGWLAFENVDWDDLRGHSSPPEARFRMYVYLGEGTGTGEWLVAADPFGQGSSRVVKLPALGASVTYNIM